MSQSVYKTYSPIGLQDSAPSESWESEYMANNDVPVSEPWLITEQNIDNGVDAPCCGGGRGGHRPKTQPGLSDDADGCITAPMVKVLKLILASLLDTTIENQLKSNCLGCEYDHPSQLKHSCLFEPETLYFQANFDKLVAKVKTPWLGCLLSKALKVFGLKPNPVRIEGAVDTIVSELKDELYIREKLREIKRADLGAFSDKIVAEVRRDFWEIAGATQEDLWGDVSEDGPQMTTV